jgi:1-pyrroline-5-carboxylate dehydrogenase
VHEKVYDPVREEGPPLVGSLKQGAPYDSREVNLGPVINENAAQSILNYIEAGKTEGDLLAGGMRAAGQGYFIQPTVFGDVPPDAPPSRWRRSSVRCWQSSRRRTSTTPSRSPTIPSTG